MKVLSSILFILLFSAVSQAEPLQIAQDPWPPFADDTAEGHGLSIEVVRAALEPMGYQFEMNFVPWARALNGVKNTNYDILAAAWYTEERSKYLAYSDSYITNEVKFIKRRNDFFEYTGFESLTGKEVGVIREYGYGDAFLTAPNFTRHATKDLLSNIRKLLANRIDLTLEDEIVARAIIARNEPNLIHRIEFVSQPLSTNALYIAVGRKHPQHQKIIRDFNEGLHTIKKNGQFQIILDKYIQ